MAWAFDIDKYFIYTIHKRKQKIISFYVYHGGHYEIKI